MPSHGEVRTLKPRVIEIVGPAATGKTTVFRSLLHRYGNTVIGKPRLRQLRYLPFFARDAVALAPLIFDRGHRPLATRERISKMVYLHVLARVLQGESSGIADVRVLDQGPVYLLAKLRDGYRPEPVSPWLAAWEDESLDTWSSVLDAVIWLDAPDTLLLERIDNRGKPHALKGTSADHALAVLARARRSSESVITELSSRSPGFAVQRFDTSRASLDDIVGAVAVACGLPRR